MTKGSVANSPRFISGISNLARGSACLQARFAIKRLAWIPAVFGVLWLSGCQPESVRQERNLRRQLSHELHNHSFATAAPIARQLLQRKPRDERLWKQLIQAQLGLHDLEGARESLQRWHTTIPSPSIRAEEFHGDIAHEEHDYPAALATWDKVLQAQPNNRRVRQKVALLHQTMGHWADAETAWDAAIKLKETVTERLNRALCRRRLHHWDAAFEDFQHAQQLGADDPEVRRWSKVFDGLQQYKEQIGELDAKIGASPEEVGLLGDRALVFLRADDPEMALEDAENASKLGPWAARPKLFQGIALVQLGRAKQLDAIGLRKPLSVQSLAPEFLETVSRLDLAIAVERTNPEHFITRSWHLNEIGQPKLALQDAETAVSLDSRSAGAMTELAYALTKLGRPDEAYDKVRQATQFDSSSASGWQYRGELEMSRGDFLSAVDSLSHAAGIHQTVAVLRKRAECYERLGLNARAQEDRRSVQQLLATTVQ
jgi:tetratricopeptide (TPR) repeat protein